MAKACINTRTSQKGHTNQYSLIKCAQYSGGDPLLTAELKQSAMVHILISFYTGVYLRVCNLRRVNSSVFLQKHRFRILGELSTKNKNESAVCLQCSGISSDILMI